MSKKGYATAISKGFPSGTLLTLDNSFSKRV